jgi:hypothetical protein
MSFFDKEWRREEERHQVLLHQFWIYKTEKREEFASSSFARYEEAFILPLPQKDMACIVPSFVHINLYLIVFPHMPLF